MRLTTDKHERGTAIENNGTDWAFAALQMAAELVLIVPRQEV